MRLPARLHVTWDDDNTLKVETDAGTQTRILQLMSFGEAAGFPIVIAIVGAVMMGFGGVTALGCTIGQGLTGLSTLALGSLIAFGGIRMLAAFAAPFEW